MRVLVCGASGMIGHKLWQALMAREDEVFATLHGPRTPYVKYQLFDKRVFEDIEAADFANITRLLDRVQPNVIINCIGITKRKVEANDLTKMFVVNARFPHHLARWAANHGARVIHFSTDCVFDGADGNYHERSVVTAPDLYGQTKYFGELDYNHCLTIRTSMIGRELSGYTELLEWFLAQNGKRITGYTKAFYSGLTTLAMAAIVPRIIHEHPDLRGRCQIAGPVISKHDLLSRIRDFFHLDVEIVPDGKFHCDRTMQSQKFFNATGITTPSWDEMLAELANDREFYDPPRS